MPIEKTRYLMICSGCGDDIGTTSVPILEDTTFFCTNCASVEDEVEDDEEVLADTKDEEETE